MGLIKAFAGSASSFMNDLWEDYIYCDSLDDNILVQKGRKKLSPGASGNVNDNLITEGSRIAVNAGQALIVVEHGNIIDFCAEPGGYIFKSDAEPSIFCGDFGDALKVSFEMLKERFKFGGIAGNDQRAYFVNTKEILDNPFGFGQVPYRDSEFDITVLLRGYGNYTFIISDPLKFYTEIAGNVEKNYDKAVLIGQTMRTELQNAILPVLGELSEEEIRYDKLPAKAVLLIDRLNAKLAPIWENTRGIKIKSINFSNLLPDDASIEKIRQLQESRAYSDNRAMMGARVGAATANAMESAAENPNGAVSGFMGMGMAQNAGAINVNDLMKETPEPKRDIQESKATEGGWKCSCGYEIPTQFSTMKFCPNCGNKKEELLVCKGCGYEIPQEFASMKFCPSCGTQRN